MKNKLILRIGALAFAMATVFTVSLQKNSDLANNDVVALADGDIVYMMEVGAAGGTVCFCKVITPANVCTCNAAGSKCAEFAANGNCWDYDGNCR